MLLDVKSLTKRFGGLTAVSNVAFGIERGEIIGIFGPNGSGKTTTLSLIAGILKPTSGVILWKGNDISTLSAVRGCSARVGQDLSESAALS
ncbi:ATP-binding cassette domain-containing protein [Bradyrhizobium elkanii]|uniref:ATP-binding cassette domain-containing protein n=1 Tax=Bradyrhizobium elkanii TaxID=29448 RepID=UPI0035176EF6